MRFRIWNRLLRDGRALAGMVFVFIVTVIAIGGAYLRPDSTVNANQQDLSLARLGPGEVVQVLKVPIENESKPSLPAQGLLFGGLSLENRSIPFDRYRFSEDSILIYWKGEVREGMLLVEAMHDVQPDSYRKDGDRFVFSIRDGQSMNLTLAELRDRMRNECIGEKRFILGTDSFGRDMLSRLMGGAIISLSVGFISVLISLVIGIPLGAMAGYFGGRWDAIIMWFINVIWSIPTLLMVIAITLVLGKGFVQVFIAVGLTMWVEVARIVRGQFIALRELPFVQAARSMGFSDARIMLKHLLPNAIGPVIVISAANFASAILIEAGLSFLGIGTQIPMPSWGTMIKEHYAYITTDLAYLAILPGLCITALVLSFMLIGNSLREAFDVRSA